VKKASWIRALGAVCVVAVITAGCGGGGESGVASQEAAFEPVKDQYAALQAKRQELTDLRARADAAAEEGVEAAEEGAVATEEAAAGAVEDLDAQIDRVKGEVDALSEQFMGSLIGFLNEANMVEGEAPSDLTLEAIRMKSGEDLLIAREYVTRGGDYRRAIEIVTTALALDPENPDLLAAKSQFETEQYMTEDRLAQVSKGMSEDQVKQILGTPHPSNIREYPEQNVVAWFYRREDRGAAGVYFQSKNDVLSVYKVDFNAVNADEEAE
jgi:outer membrane protein assembly factor BamE (lipoprotein component of BamABCDE complex)